MIIQEMNNQYEVIEKQLEKVSKIIFSIDEDTRVLSHELMELGGEVENLGLMLNELNEKVGLKWI